MMNVAKAMLTVLKLEVGTSVIVQGNALEVGQDACDSHTDMSPFVVDAVVGQFLGAGHVQPPQATIDTQATLVEMDDRSSDQLLANLFQACLRVAGKLACRGENGRLLWIQFGLSSKK